MQDRLRFEAPSGDVLLFYAAADVYVGPSLEDSFGLPILEAMACGLPVIASAHAGASEMIMYWQTAAGMKMPKRPENSWKVLSSSHPRIDSAVIRMILRKYYPGGRTLRFSAELFSIQTAW
jgi:hypothetical protein